MAIVPRLSLALATLLSLAPLAAGAFSLESAEIKRNATIAAAQVYNGFGCTGGNISPSLAWKDPPAGVRSYAITVYDPDAPTGSGWWHWVVYNLPATTTSLPAGAGDRSGAKLPAGAVHGRTDFGTPGFGGPCPPQGDKPHRYIFTVHALRIDKLDVPADATAALIGFMINANRLGNASFTGMYGRK